MQTFVLPISQKGRLIEAVGFLGPGWTWQGKQLGRAEWKLVESGHDLETREKQLLGTGAGEPGSSHRKPSEDLTLTYLSPVVSWIDVYARATCQPREVVVPLTMELMGTVAKQLVPSCVTVQRCGGCCPDDGLECVPTGQHQVRMQVWGRGACLAAVDAGVLGTGVGSWVGCSHPSSPRALSRSFLFHVSFLVLSTDPDDPVPKQSAGGDVPGRTQPV